MHTDAERLATADGCHDDDPQRAATLLCEIAPSALGEADWLLYAFLLNHVLGERLADWAGAHRRLGPLLAQAGDAAPAVLWRQAAVAARLGGDAGSAASATEALARSASVSPAQAQDLVSMAAASFTVPGAAAAQAGASALAALAPLDAAHWQTPSALDAAAAAICNNLAAGLSERPLADLRDPVLRDALRRAANGSQRLWQRAGDWVNQERAWYGVAVAATALGDAATAIDAARAGLALLDRHDLAQAQRVDRAFLELELAHSLQCAGKNDEALPARARADALAQAFDDPSLPQWYAARVERHRQLSAD